MPEISFADAAIMERLDVNDDIGLRPGAQPSPSGAKEQAKTFASELENMGRRNPLGAMAAALMVGVLIGLIGRGRSNS